MEVTTKLSIVLSPALHCALNRCMEILDKCYVVNLLCNCKGEAREGGA